MFKIVATPQASDAGTAKPFEMPISIKAVDDSSGQTVNCHGATHGRSQMTTSGGDLYELGQATETTLPDVAVAHEFGHALLGASDEYANPAVPGRVLTSDHSILANYYAEGIAAAEFKVRHLQHLLAPIAAHFPGYDSRPRVMAAADSLRQALDRALVDPTDAAVLHLAYSRGHALSGVTRFEVDGNGRYELESNETMGREKVVRSGTLGRPRGADPGDARARSARDAVLDQELGRRRGPGDPHAQFRSALARAAHLGRRAKRIPVPCVRNVVAGAGAEALERGRPDLAALTVTSTRSTGRTAPRS